MMPLNTVAYMAYNSVMFAGSNNSNEAVGTKCTVANQFKPAAESLVGNGKGLVLSLAPYIGAAILICIIIFAWRIGKVWEFLITMVVIFVAATLLVSNFNIMPSACG